MALSDAQKAKAKEKAVAFLDLNITSLAAALGVDEDIVDADYVIPVDESDEQYKEYVALKTMVANRAAISS